MKPQQYKYFILLISVFSCLLVKSQLTTFYYYQGEKFYLEVDYSRISVVSEGEISLDEIKNRVVMFDFNIKNQQQSFTIQNIISIDKHNTDIFTNEIEFPDKIDNDTYLSIIHNLQNEEGVLKVSPTYTIMNKKLGISNNFYVKLYKTDDTKILYDMAKNYSIQVLGYNEFMPLWFTLSCTNETSYNALEAANIFFESKLFESSEPEFLYHNLAAINDPYFSSQWGLKNTGQYDETPGIDINAEEAWNITTGSSYIRVAVFDHGFEMNHPDLQNNVYGTGYDATTGSSPAWVRGDHGTACAGIIGAQQNNSIGVSGVAPSIRLMSISINLLISDTPQQIANGFNWAWQNGADVISNSWGGYAPSSIIDNAITNTLTNGRNGKGTVIVFAAGNENDTIIRYPGNSNPDILVVGAMNPCGQRKSPTSCDTEALWGGNFGAQLDISAPGVLVPTTDRQGNNGYNPNFHIHPENYGSLVSTDYTDRNYTIWFNGTSAACPHVAAVAALILSQNPDLTQLQVANIIESTAQRVGGYNYKTTAGRPNGIWHEEVGYGLLDAFAAVQAACPTTNFVNQTVTTNTTINGCIVNVQNVEVNNNSKLTINASNNVTIIGEFEVALGSELEIP